MNDSQALALSVSYLLDNATQESTWGDSQIDWNPIITALTCKLLLSCGLAPKTVWFINRNGYYPCTLSASFQWLNNSIMPDGKFGTDFWDASQLGILIETYSLHAYFTAYESLKRHLIQSITSRTFLADPSHWQGPAFCASAITYLRLLGELDRATSLEDELANLHQNGCWQGHAGASGIPFAVWHTAQCVILLAENPECAPEPLSKGAAWLVQAQHESGAWISVQQYNVYFTAYAVLALLHDKTCNASQIRLGLDYLKSQIAADGKCSDLGATLMCAIAFRAFVGDSFDKDITLVDYLFARKNITRAEASEHTLREQVSELTQVKAELSKYEAKYGDAEFAITKRGLFVLALAGLFIAILGNLGSALLTTLLERSLSPAAVHVTQQPPQTEPHPPKNSGAQVPSGANKPASHAPERSPGQP